MVWVLRYRLEKIGTPSALLMKENLYVDNLIISMKSTEEAIVFQQEADQYFADAKMRIREWMSNDEEVMEAIPEKDCASSRFPKILGVRWDMNRDTKDPRIRQSASTGADKERIGIDPHDL